MLIQSIEHLPRAVTLYRKLSRRIALGPKATFRVSDDLYESLSFISAVTRCSHVNALRMAAEVGATILAERFRFVLAISGQQLDADIKDAMEATGYGPEETVLRLVELGIRAGRQSGWRNLRGEE